MTGSHVRQSCPWVGSTRGLGWVGLGRDFAVFDGLGWVEYDKSTISFDAYTTYNCKGPCQINTRGYEKLAFFASFRKRYNIRPFFGRSLTAISFAVSCIGLGWVTQLMSWVGSGHRNGPTDNSVLHTINRNSTLLRRPSIGTIVQITVKATQVINVSVVSC